MAVSSQRSDPQCVSSSSTNWHLCGEKVPSARSWLSALRRQIKTSTGMAANDMVVSWLSAFHCALHKQDVTAVVNLFQEECFWRDLVAFTWNLYTAESRKEIAAMLEATLMNVKPFQWELDGEARETEEGSVDACIKFDTAVGRGRGHVRLKAGKCWTLLTAIAELKGHEEKAGKLRPQGLEYGAVRGRKSWLEEKLQEEAELGYCRQPYCVVVGGGQGGIALGARFRRLGVPSIIVEKYARPGDSWRNRYSSLCLHDPVWQDHLPYIPFPEHWPVFSSKDMMANWLEAYTKLMEINYWASTECKSARFDPAEGRWEVLVDRAGKEVTLRPTHLVLATGMAGMPDIPSIPGADSFQGVQLHSSQYQSGERWTGKNCVIIGSNNSAHDICADLWEHGAAEVTMVQRSSTHIVRSLTRLTDPTLGGLYKEDSPFSTDTCDLLIASVPYKLLPRLHIPVYHRIAARDADLYDRLRKAGFLLDFGEDGSGGFVKYLRRGSGYYIDVGASDLVANGEIKLKSGETVAEVKPKAVLLSDGSQLPADLIVYASGFGSMNAWTAKLISQEVADRVGKCWGLGSETTKDPGPWEGELRNMWKPTQQPGLWFQGGNLLQARYYSLMLALQIKARLEGIPTPVYGLPAVQHLM